MLAVFAKSSVSPVWWLPMVIVGAGESVGLDVAHVKLPSNTTGPIVGSYVTEAPAATTGAKWVTSTEVVTTLERLLVARPSFTCQEIVRVFALLRRRDRVRCCCR